MKSVVKKKMIVMKIMIVIVMKIAAVKRMIEFNDITPHPITVPIPTDFA